MGVDSAGEEVVHINETWRLRATLVNTDLAKFAETARLMTQRFPYGVSHDRLEEAGEAANAMRAIIRSVDAYAAMPGTYWPDYADEIDGWFYGLNEVLEWYQARQVVLPMDESRNSGRQMTDPTVSSDIL
jgi:hypothetical protein